jgi:acyl-CoA synthetase (AMP-forming)/AMP-acid ligase II
MTSDSMVGGADHETALISGDRELTYAQLRAQTHAVHAELDGLTFLRAGLDIDSIALYVACLEVGAPVLLLDNDLDADALTAMTERYRPRLVAGFDLPVPARMSAGRLTDYPFPVWRRADGAAETHPALALLLSTSGSTGSPKLVRLSRDAVLANADAIIAGLGIEPGDRAITALPYSYTYGLSIINSHLRAGATVVVTDATVVSAPFWHAVDTHRVTALAGVPTTYRLLRRMRWDVSAHPSVRYATQAGGRLPDPEREHFRDMFARSGGLFRVMYGQTEATARITITGPSDLFDAISTAGRVVTGGALEIRAANTDGVGEVWYRGANVMLGYAEDAADLARSNELGGVLDTGDLGYLEDGRLFLTGRSKRIAKVFGKRVSLDDVDQWLQSSADGASVAGDDGVIVFTTSVDPASVRTALATHLHVHPTGVQVVHIDEIPLMPSGKVDYRQLTQRAQQ